MAVDAIRDEIMQAQNCAHLSLCTKKIRCTISITTFKNSHCECSSAQLIFELSVVAEDLISSLDDHSLACRERNLPIAASSF